MNYILDIKDAVTKETIPLAKIYLLESAGGNAILANGIPVAFETDVNGHYELNTASPPLFVRVQATGYASKNVVLGGGQTTIELDGVNSAGATINAARTFFSKYKFIILTAIALLMLLAAVKFKILK